MLMVTAMQEARPRCLHNSSLWTLSCIGMHVSWDTKLKDGTYFLKQYMPFIKAIGAPFRISTKINYTSSRTKCTYEELTWQIHGDCLSHFSPLIYFGKRELRAPQWMVLLLSTCNLAESSRIKAILICHKYLEPQQLMQKELRKNLWTWMAM